MAKAIFAAGCFWGVQFYFDQIDGVSKTTVGYTGGRTKNPSYEDVCYKQTGHAEAVEIEFDENKISYETLVKQFLYMHDPTQAGGQGPDIGDQYRSAIYYVNDNQLNIANDVLQASITNYDTPIVTEVAAATDFYPAEEYHQKYASKTGRGMCHKPFKSM